ncbi:hypothetical protein M0804_009402 [Polistes exclamans]|nr:hypothetical protein M0804_009402 [Polistes exclamans]
MVLSMGPCSRVKSRARTQTAVLQITRAIALELIPELTPTPISEPELTAAMKFAAKGARTHSCQPCSGCPMRPCPPERSCPATFICPQSSPRNICIVPPIPQKPSWKPCCIRIYGIPCNRHSRPRKFIQFNDFDFKSQW